MKATERAYFAGLIDGEGSIYVGKNRPVGPEFAVSVKMADDQAVRSLASLYSLTVQNVVDRRPNHRMCYRVDLTGGTARAFLQEIRPYLKVKTRQADAVLSCRMDSKAEREATAALLHELNRRGTHHLLPALAEAV